MFAPTKIQWRAAMCEMVLNRSVIQYVGEYTDDRKVHWSWYLMRGGPELLDAIAVTYKKDSPVSVQDVKLPTNIIPSS